MASAAVCSKVVVLLLIHCLLLLPLSVGLSVWSLFRYTVLSVLSSFEIISPRKRELVALLYLFPRCHVAVSVLCLFLTVPWVGLQCVSVAFLGHTYFFFLKTRAKAKIF